MMKLLFNKKGDYLERPTVGGIEYESEVAVDVLPEWEGKLDCITLVDGVVTFNPNKHYSRERVVAYPDIVSQLDMIYWDSKNSTTTWADAIDKIKSDYPKEA